MQKLHYNKNTHMHTTHTHIRTPQAELNHRSERDLRVTPGRAEHVICSAGPRTGGTSAHGPIIVVACLAELV